MRVKFLTLCMVFNFVAKAQNGIGVFGEYLYFNHKNWNSITSIYNAHDSVTHKLNAVHHFPQAGIVYERKFSEFLYFQLFSGFSYTVVQSTSMNGKLKIEMQNISAGLNTNWYPVKMVKGLKVTAFNPLFVRIGFAASYMQTKLRYNGEQVYAEDKKKYSYNQFPMHGIAGLGYDLHFGKRIIFQTVLKATYYPSVEIPEYNYLVPNVETYGYSTDGSAITYGLHFTVLYLFK